MTTALSFRGLHYSLGQGNYDDLLSLWRLVPLVADCGFNQLIFYMDGAWRLHSHPALADRQAYRPEDMGRLAEFAAGCGIDLIPSISTVSHCRYILNKPRYRHLSIGPGADMDVLNPSVYRLFGEIFDEILPHFSSSYVFINGDEMNLTGLNERARRVARREGLGALHGRGLGRLAAMILKRGRRPIVWHDMFFHHPEGLKYLPKKTVIAYWHYDHQPEYPAIRFFRDRGFDVIAASSQWCCWDPTLPDYRRHLPNIQGQAQAAAQAAGRGHGRGRCLGSMLTIWERNAWRDTTLGIYAAGRWFQKPKAPLSEVLRDFAMDVFGVPNRNIGKILYQTTGAVNRLVSLKGLHQCAGSAAGQQTIRREISKGQRRMARWCPSLTEGRPNRNRDLYQDTVAMVHRMGQLKVPTRTIVPRPEKLFCAQVVDPDDRSCRLIEQPTAFGHRLAILTNGLISIAMLPEFGGSLIEWVIHDREPWSMVLNNYQRWARAMRREPFDRNPAIGSPWAACGLGGWRETVFFNTRMNPCTLWGHPFEIKVQRQEEGRLIVACCGQNEVAKVTRLITLEKGKRCIDICSSATNRYDACWMAIQPNVCHRFPDVPPPLLRMMELDEGRRRYRSIWDHDGTLIFYPTSDNLKIGSPLSRHYMKLRCPRSQTWGLMSEVRSDYFTLEPYGRIRFTNRGETVHLDLRYELA